MNWVNVWRLVVKHGAPFVVAAVEAALGGVHTPQSSIEAQRRKDMWTAMRAATWEERTEHGHVLRYCKVCGKWEVDGCRRTCVFRVYPREG